MNPSWLIRIVTDFVHCGGHDLQGIVAKVLQRITWPLPIEREASQRKRMEFTREADNRCTS
jgi:hypothetical protein